MNASSIDMYLTVTSRYIKCSKLRGVKKYGIQIILRLISFTIEISVEIIFKMQEVSN